MARIAFTVRPMKVARNPCSRRVRAMSFREGLLFPIAIVDIGENIIEFLDSREPGFVDLSCRQLFVQGDEAKQVSLDALARVLGACAGAKNEWPIAGLGQEQLASGLFQSPGPGQRLAIHSSHR